MGEPLIHSHVTDVLPEDHALAYEQVSCGACGELVHAANNECMQTWIEWDGIIVCMNCFLGYLHENPGEASVLERMWFEQWFQVTELRRAARLCADLKRRRDETGKV